MIVPLRSTDKPNIRADLISRAPQPIERVEHKYIEQMTAFVFSAARLEPRFDRRFRRRAGEEEE